MIRTSLFAAGFASFLALGATGCGDSSGEDPRGALHVRVNTAATPPAGMSCNNLFMTEKYIPADDLLPNETGPGVAFASGENKLTVSCKVSGSSGFDVELQLGDGDVSFSLRGRLDESGVGTGFTGTISKINWVGAGLKSLAQNAQTCTLTASGGAFFVKPGTVFGSFDCPILTNPPSTACRMNGHVFFERCSD